MNRIGVICAGTGGTNIGEVAWQVCERMYYIGQAQRPEFLFIETNAVPISKLKAVGVPKESRMLIGHPTPLGGRGSFNDPQKAAMALNLKKNEIMTKMSSYDIIFLIVTFGKGTGMGTFPLLLQWATELKKWVVPIVAEPALGGEIEAGPHGLVIKRIDEIRQHRRIIHIANCRVFDPSSSLPKDAAFRQINESIGGAIGHFAVQLAEGSKIDPSDTARLLAGGGHLYMGHAMAEIPTEMPTPEYIKKEVREMARRCLGVRYLLFDGDVDNAFWGLTVHKEWPAWVQKEMREAGAAQLFEIFGKKLKPPKNSLPPADFYVDRGMWGMTVMLSNDTGVHEPLPLPALVLDEECEEVSVRESPAPIHLHSKDSAFVHEQAPAPAEDLGLPTFAVSQAPKPEEVPLPASHGLRPMKKGKTELGRFITSVSNYDREVMKLAQQSDLVQLPFAVSPDDLREQIMNLPLFRQVYSRLSPAWRHLLLEEVKRVSIGDVQVVSRRLGISKFEKRESIRDLPYAKFERLSADAIPEEQRADFRFIKNVCVIWDEAGYEACLGAMTGRGYGAVPVEAKTPETNSVHVIA